MNECEMCGYKEKNCLICPKCGFYMHYHEYKDRGYLEHQKKMIVIYPYLNKKIENKYRYMHIKINSEEL